MRMIWGLLRILTDYIIRPTSRSVYLHCQRSQVLTTLQMTLRANWSDSQLLWKKFWLSLWRQPRVSTTLRWYDIASWVGAFLAGKKIVKILRRTVKTQISVLMTSKSTQLRFLWPNKVKLKQRTTILWSTTESWDKPTLKPRLVDKQKKSKLSEPEIFQRLSRLTSRIWKLIVFSRLPLLGQIRTSKN